MALVLTKEEPYTTLQIMAKDYNQNQSFRLKEDNEILKADRAYVINELFKNNIIKEVNTRERIQG